MKRNCCQVLPPSMFAASYISLGIAVSVASNVMAKNGMPNQMFAKIGRNSQGNVRGR